MPQALGEVKGKRWHRWQHCGLERIRNEPPSKNRSVVVRVAVRRPIRSRTTTFVSLVHTLFRRDYTPKKWQLLPTLAH